MKRMAGYIGALLAIIGIVSFVYSPSAQARGEQYKWLNPTTIEASGGQFTSVRSFSLIGSGRQGDKLTGSFRIGSCTLTAVISPNAAQNGGEIIIQDPGAACSVQYNMLVTSREPVDQSVTITATENAPKAIATTVNYATVDCSIQFSLTNDQRRCQAIKSCIANKLATQAVCVTAFDTCTGSDNSFAKIADCSSKLSAGALPGVAKLAQATEEKTPTTCSINGIGWLLCPIAYFLASVSDAAYGALEKLLTVQPLLATGATKGVFESWSLMRNIANVAFVIVFLVIIFSQVTSIGLSNYGIKRMLPRLIMAAILVNASYWLCAVAVDISNIFGTATTGLFDGVVKQLIASLGIKASTGLSLGELAGTALVTAGTLTVAFYLGLSIFLPMLITVAATIVTIFIILTIRQVLIILLVVVSPLAFVAYLLPNTQNLYSKWSKTFLTLLLMFPAVAAIFGAAKLASVIVGQSSNDFFIKVVAEAMKVIPLIVAIGFIKTASALLNRFGDPSKGPLDSLRKAASGYRDNRQEFRKLKAMNGERSLPGVGTFMRKKARRQAILANRKSELGRSTAEYVATTATNDDLFRAAMAAGGGEGADQRARSSARAQLDKIHRENTDNHYTDLKGTSEQDLRALSLGGGAAQHDRALREAAMRHVIDSGDTDGVNALLNQTQAGRQDTTQAAQQVRESLANALDGSKETPSYVGASARAAIRNPEANQGYDFSAGGLMQRALSENTYSPTKIANAPRSELGAVANFVEANRANLNPDHIARLGSNAQLATTDPRIAPSLGKNRENAQRLASLAPAPPATPTQTPPSRPPGEPGAYL